MVICFGWEVVGLGSWVRPMRWPDLCSAAPRAQQDRHLVLICCDPCRGSSGLHFRNPRAVRDPRRSVELPSDIAARMSAAEDGAAGPGAVDDAAVAPLVEVEVAPGNPGARTSATASDWAMCDANKDDSFSDSVRSSLENMCRRVGGPVHYLRTRFPTVESKTEFAAWLWEILTACVAAWTLQTLVNLCRCQSARPRSVESSMCWATSLMVVVLLLMMSDGRFIVVRR